ncbi:MAG TPA: hypothetical protein VFU97_01150 [Xanthobacteraceae bacterium]|nr:hypothetical protein [Xanthobacteraceae bacterium]
MTIGAAVSNYLDRDKQQRATLSPFLAVAFPIIGLLLTVKAAPIMLALAQPP